MKKLTRISAVFLLGLLFAACSNEENMPRPADRQVEIMVGVDNYVKDITTARAIDVAGSAAESQIGDLYLFLFNTEGTSVDKYYIVAPTFTGGTWTSADRKIALTMTQAEAGTRQVYVVANCGDLRAQLDDVANLPALQAVFRTLAAPWSPNLTTPILMSGSATHNFIDNRVLSTVKLIRAFAKVELNVTLKPEHQSIPVVNSAAQYKYRLISFDTRTYVVKPATKPDNLANLPWADWSAALANEVGSAYTTGGDGKVTVLKLVTYLNERDAAGSAIELQLPYIGSGPLPPPEFGPELYKLPLPAAIARNHWYKYDIEI